MRNGSGRRRGLKRREVPGAATPHRLQGRGPCTDDDVLHRPIRRRLLVEAVGNPEAIHPSHRLTRSPTSSMADLHCHAIHAGCAMRSKTIAHATPTIRCLQGPKSLLNAPREPRSPPKTCEGHQRKCKIGRDCTQVPGQSSGKERVTPSRENAATPLPANPDDICVRLVSHNRWNGFTVLLDRRLEHLSGNRTHPVLLVDEAMEMQPAVLNELRLPASNYFVPFHPGHSAMRRPVPRRQVPLRVNDATRIRTRYRLVAARRFRQPARLSSAAE